MRERGRWGEREGGKGRERERWMEMEREQRVNCIHGNMRKE